MLDADFFETRGYQVVDHFLDQEDTRRIGEYIENLFLSNQMKKAGIGKESTFEVNKELRGDFIQWVNPEETIPQVELFLSRLKELMSELNRNFYLGIRDFEAHFTRYPEGTRYVAHSDRHAKGSTRVVSFVFYLNENWTEEDGGQLRIFQEDGTSADIAPEFGRLAFFLSDKLHEVLTTNRVRRSITGWWLNELRII